MNAHWEQFSYQEVMSMHGIEMDGEDENEEMEYDFTEEASQEDCCQRCNGSGCNWCLMLDY
jgi:hypothetical protein